jgi:predicted permease
VDKLLQDIRFGLRMMARSPGFTAVAVLSLALGIGANTAIFTLVNAVFLQPLPVRDPSTLVSVFTTDEKNSFAGISLLPTSQPNFTDIRNNSKSFAGMYAEEGFPAAVTIGKEAEEFGGDMVSGSYFDVLGVKPLLGRFFLPDEDSSTGSHPVMVLSYAVWQRKFGGDPNVVGREYMLNAHGFTVIGVAGKEFNGTNPLGGPDLWVPMATHDLVLSGILKEWYDERRALTFNVVGRLKPGVTRAQADTEVKAIFRQLAADFPTPNKGRSAAAVPLLQSTINPAFRDILLRAGGLLMVVVGLVLLIACANIANLLLARATGRSREIAIRLALGASRTRLVTQLVTESLLLALAGGALGLGIGVLARNMLWNMRPAPLLDSHLDLSLNAHVLLFTAGISILTGLLFGLAPAGQMTRPDLTVELKERAGQAAHASRAFSLRNGFVVAELGLALITLLGAGLFLLSLRNAQRIDPGFDTRGLAMMNFNLGTQGYDRAHGIQFYRDLKQRIETLPGVRGATVAGFAPLFGGGFARSVFPEGHEQDQQRSGILVQVDPVGPGYFAAMGIPLVSGRDLDDSIHDTDREMVVINQTMAKRFWPGEDPLGKRFKFFGDPEYTEVIGVVRDSKYNTIGEDPTPFVYLPMVQSYQPAATLLVRAPGDTAAVITAARQTVRALDPQLPLRDVFTYERVLQQSLWAPRMGAGLLTIFASLALLLAAIGIYGVMAYSVGQRAREIGIRMALGAHPGDVLRLILRHAAGLVAVGLGIGLLAALATARLIAGLLYGINATDPMTFATVTVALAVVGMLASYFPARRATRVDPMVALRYE